MGSQAQHLEPGVAFLHQEGGICIPDPPSQMEYGIHVLMEYIVFMYYVFSMLTQQQEVGFGV